MAATEILNASYRPIVTKYDGATQVFKPGEIHQVTDAHRAHNVLNRWGKYGLVDVTYSSKVSEKYPVRAVFIHEKKLEGLSRLLETLYGTSQGFQTYDEEMGTNKPPEKFQMQRKHKEVLAEIDLVTKLLEDANNVDVVTLKRDHAEQLQAKAAALLAEAEALDVSAKTKEVGEHGKNTGHINGNARDRAKRS